MLRRAVLLVTVLTSACTLLAPSKDEYFSEATAPTGNGGIGGTAGGQFPSGGTAGAGAIGSGATSSGGGTSGGGAPGGGAPGGGAPGGGGSGGAGATGGSGGATCGSCDDTKLCTDDACVSGNCEHTPNCVTSAQTCAPHTSVCPTGQYIILGQLRGGGCSGAQDTLLQCACPCGSPFYTCDGSCPPGYTEASSGVHPDCEVLRRECVK